LELPGTKAASEPRRLFHLSQLCYTELSPVTIRSAMDPVISRNHLQ
jgi:hypothetical protein